jgi:hypothetical protein
MVILSFFVMAGLVPAIHVFASSDKGWEFYLLLHNRWRRHGHDLT